MKILVFADPHGSISSLKKVEALAKKEKVEYILCVGDLTVFEQNLDKLVQKIDKWGIPILMIHGNHEEKSILEYVCNKSKNVKFIHKQTFRVGDVLILGYGGGGFTEYDPKFDDLAEEWEDEIEKKDKVILMTHQPPYGFVDLVGDTHTGSKSILRFIKKAKPLFCFCGHIHDTFEEEDKVKKTRVINPGPDGKVYTI